MLLSHLAFLAYACLLLPRGAPGFAPTAPSPTAAAARCWRPSTCLRAEGEEEAAGADGVVEDIPAPAEPKSAADDILNSPAFLKRKLEVLRTDLAAVEQSLAEAKERYEAGKAEWGPQIDDLQREYQNIQQRMSTQNNAGDNMATVQVARQMLNVLDNYDRAFGVIRPETDAEKAIEAEYKEAYDMVLQTFEKMGVKQVETIGKEFDYENHQAVMQRPSDEFEEGIVCDELQKGYRCGDQLVRAAMVVVAA